MLKKPLAVGIILLFVSSSAIPIVISDNPISTKIIYVDDDGGADYARIQDAIAAAEDGDTVFVYSGEYFGNVVIDKSIYLIGEDKNTTIIDGGGRRDVVYISADFIEISGFTIQNSGKLVSGPDWHNAGIDIRSNNNIITDNIISNNLMAGIVIGCHQISPTRHNIIKDNTISSNTVYGIYLYSDDYNYFASTHTSITDNIISSNGCGIDIFNTINNTIADNTLASNNLGIDVNIVCYCHNTTVPHYNNAAKNITDPNKGDEDMNLGDTIHNLIMGNNLISNSMTIHDDYGGNNITDNSFTNCGLSLSLWSRDNIYQYVVSNNTVNGKPLVFLMNESDKVITNAGQVILAICDNITIQNQELCNTTTGVKLLYTKNCNVLDNNMSNNQHYGILLIDSTNNLISNNNICSNNRCGINLNYGSDNNFIIGNNITSNNNGGVKISGKNNLARVNNIYLNNGTGISMGHSKIYDSNNILKGNNIILNKGTGIRLHSCRHDIIMENNIISNNKGGIHLRWSSNHVFYHNNLINNTQNAFDSDSSNTWYNSTLKEGNYWDDYTGVDADDDGIGDIPYDIPSWDNQDQYPLMEPYVNPPPNASTITGPNIVVLGEQYEYSIVSTDSDGEDIYYHIDLGNGTEGSWIGPYESGEEIHVMISFSKIQNYIHVKAKDSSDKESNWTEFKVLGTRYEILVPILQFLYEHRDPFPLLSHMLLLDWLAGED